MALRAYTFDEGSGTTAAEAGGGTSLTGVPGWATGLHGTALDLHNVNGPNVPAFGSSTAFTIMFDVYREAVGGGGYTMFIRGTPGEIGTLQQGSGNTLEWYPWLGPSGVEVPLNTWTHVAIVASGTTRRIVVNGVQAASVANTELSGTNVFTLGGESGYEPDLRMDNLRVYDTALSNAEILALAGTEVTAPPLTANISDSIGITDVRSISSTAAWVYIADSLGVTDTESEMVVDFTESRSDAVGLTDALIAYIGDSNVAPVADAGPSQSVVPNETVTLNGAGSTDSDGTIVTYTWVQVSGSGPLALSGTGATRTFATAVPGTYVFGLIVTDDRGQASAQDTVTITVASTADLLRLAGYVPYIVVPL